MSLYKPWLHCIDGRTIVQESQTALIIDSNWSYDFGPTEWVWVQEGSILWCLFTQGISSGDVCWVAAEFWGAQPSFFATLSFALKSAFHAVLLMSFRQSHTRWSGLPHLKLLFFCWYSLTALAKGMIYSLGWSVWSALPNALTSLSAEGSISLTPSCFSLGSSPTSLVQIVAAWVVKVWLPFSLHEEKMFPEVWECYIQYTGHGCLRGAVGP